jgi:hypothetical protein
MGPTEKVEFYAVAPEKCPTCRGTLNDYNAETVITGSAMGNHIPHSTALISHFNVCQSCGVKLARLESWRCFAVNAAFRNSHFLAPFLRLEVCSPPD